MERFSEKNKLPKYNLTDMNKNPIEHFLKCSDLVITKAGKSVAFILDSKSYIAKANEQFQDNSLYQ